MPLLPESVSAVAVYLEKRKSRQFVGKLTKEDEIFVFEYDKKYLYSKNIIPMGPEFPLTRIRFESKSLFASFADRIPEKENPAYPDYCQLMDISVDENNPIILLVTIGKRGPSSFVFEPIYEDSYSSKDLSNFRKRLNLTVREFADCFSLSPSAVNRIEKGDSSGRDILKRVEIYDRFPEVALYQIAKTGGVLSRKKQQYINHYFRTCSE